MFKANLGGFGLVPWKATVQEMKTIRFYKEVILDGFATFMFMTLATHAFMVLPTSNAYVVSFIGFLVVGLVEAYIHVAPVLFNPNFVIAFIFSGRISVPKGILCIAIEIAMAVAATTMVYEITPEEVRVLLQPPGPILAISDGYVWVCEFIAVLFVVTVLVGATDGRRKTVQMPHIPIGLTLVAVASMGAPYGTGLSPIVSFGISYVADSWDRSWIYWTAGPAGSFVATILYYFFAYDEGSCARVDPNDHEDRHSLELAKGIINGGYKDDHSIVTISPAHMDSQINF